MKHLSRIVTSCMLATAIISPAVAQDKVTLAVMFDQTGPGGPYAKRGENGFNLALDQAREAGTLKVEIVQEKADAGGNPQRAATLATEAVNSDAVFAVYGTSSGPALAMASITQQAQLPFMVVQATTPQLLAVGDYVYASAAYYRTFHELYAKYLGAQGIKKLSVIYTGDAPSFNELGSKDYVAFGEKYGFEVDLNEVAIATTDFTTVTRKMLSGDPDAIAFLLYGPQSATFVSLLRQANYQGIVGANTITDWLAAAGDQATGIYSPAPYAPPITCEGGVKFGEAYQAAFGAPADDISANGYNAGRMLVRALELADGDFSRENMKASMDQVLVEGLTDTATCTLSFEGREPKLPGILIQIENGQQIEVKTE